jgi:hypothetical protein
MTAIQRWCIVALGGLVLAAAAMAWPRLAPVIAPIADPGASDARDRSAADLIAMMEDSANAPYSGYVETLGTLQLPVASRFTDVGELLGERTKMRVWWRGPDQWRVDKLLPAGETDLIHRGDQTVEWSYEKSEATAYFDPDIRLPRTSDLLPPALGARAVVDVDRDSARRIGDRRVAGRIGLGLRIRASTEGASIDHVDVWSDATTGIPLRLEVYVASAGTPSFTSEFREFSAQRPPTSTTVFAPPAGATLSSDDVLDIADAANRYADGTAPEQLAGFRKTGQSRGAVGVYGAGMTQLIAIPLWDRGAVPLREQLGTSPAVQDLPEGRSLSIGPLGVLLTEYRDGSGWLLAGTVDRTTLIRAARRIREIRP